MLKVCLVGGPRHGSPRPPSMQYFLTLSLTLGSVQIARSEVMSASLLCASAVCGICRGVKRYADRYACKHPSLCALKPENVIGSQVLHWL